MVIFVLVGVFGSFVAVAMLIAVLKCCVESLADNVDDRQKLGKINTYKSRYADANRRDTYETDDLTEVWATNDDNGTDTQWNSPNIESGGNEGDSRLEDGCDSTTGVKNDSKSEADNDPKSGKDDTTLGGEDKEISAPGVESKFEGSGHDATFSGESHSRFGQSEHDSTFVAESHSAFGGGHDSSFGGEHGSSFGGGHSLSFGGGHNSSFGGGHDSSFGGGHDSSFGGGHDSSFGGGHDSSFGGGYTSGYGGDSGGGGGDYGGGD